MILGMHTQLADVVGYQPTGERKWKVTWRCPFYDKWTSMLNRCYSEKHLAKHQSYRGCSVVVEWHRFSNFKAWMETQEWEGKELDKDILIPGNKIYGPDTCAFVDQKVNKFVNECAATRGKLPIGVDACKGAFHARCKSVVTGKIVHLGRFKTTDEAYQAWLNFKLEQAYILAADLVDERVAKALINKYKDLVNLLDNLVPLE